MLKVLIADDERAIRNGLPMLINWKGLGFELLPPVEDGRFALDVIDSRRVDVLLTDIRMPRMDGLELARTLYDRKPRIHVVIISGYQDFSYARKAIDYGVRKYLLKPVGEAELAGVMAQLAAEALERTSEDGVLDEHHAVCEVKRFVQNHYSQPLALKEMALSIGYNPSYLGRLFHEETGCTFSSYLQKFRIMRAFELIQRNRHSVSEIAEMVGFQDIDYFRRVFRVVAGVSPSEYRMQIRGGREPPDMFGAHE